ncbi:MAG: ribosomal L7Ae/L30e/S12e/Gadd45 family protein [Gemmatimonadota bacterium]|nr:ribosomal L7Ae/L30e/S12e/Gadd45 family protein [Gemmatimonadota bacterium]
MSGEVSAILRLVGLGMRGRLVAVGVDRTREAAFKGTLRLAIVASDASPNSRDKIVPLLSGRGVSMIETPSADDLGRVVGRAATAVVGVLDAKLARGIRAAHRGQGDIG